MTLRFVSAFCTSSYSLVARIYAILPCSTRSTCVHSAFFSFLKGSSFPNGCISPLSSTIEPTSLGPRGCYFRMFEAPEHALFCDMEYDLKPEEISHRAIDIPAVISVAATGISMRAMEISFGNKDLSKRGTAIVII